MKSLKQKIKNFGIGVGLVGCSLGLDGCEMNPSEFQSYVIGNGPTEREKIAAAQSGVRVQTQEGYEVNLYKGARVSYGNEIVYVLDVAPPKIELAKFKYNPRNIQEGTWVDINQLDMFDGGNQERQKNLNGGWIPVPNSFICMGYEDKNGDGYIGKDELAGLKNYFKCNMLGKENRINLVIGSNWLNAKEDNILVTIKSNNRIWYSREEKMPYEPGIRWNNIAFYKSLENYGIEKNIIEFYRNGKIDETKTIDLFIDYGNKGINE